MKKLYIKILTMLVFITSQSQTIDFSISFLGINSTTNNYQMALIATPSSTMIDANTDDIVAGFYVPTGLTLGNFEVGNSGIPVSDWSSNALGSNANGDGYYLARVETGGMSTILNGDGPFQLVLFDIIADPNPASGNITFIENGDPIFDPFFLENYININGGNNIYNQNNPIANTVDFSTLSVDNIVASDIIVSVYPNPSTEFINISINSQIDTVEFFDVTGKLVLIKTKAKRINVKELPAGIYFMKIHNGEKVLTKKIIIK